MNTEVCIKHCQSYSIDELTRVFEEIFRSPQFPEVSGRSVFLKPNILSDAKPQDCITTNPEFLRALIRVLKDKGAREIYVGDSPGIVSPTFAAKGCGIGQVCEEEGARWVDFFKENEIVTIPGTKQNLPIASIIKNVDLVFSVPKFKTHQLMYATGGVKNFFGLVPGLHKSPCHLNFPTRESFARLIAGIYQLASPDYCIMDAVVGMEGPGPANGTPRAVNLILGSADCGALDVAESILMGYKPYSLPITRELKLTGKLPDQISYPFLDPYQNQIPDFKRIKQKEKTQFLKTLIFPFFTRGFQKRRQKKEPAPVFLEERCIQCRRCVQICPAKTLKLENKKVIADFSKCIRCYCCHEVCPNQAIEIPQKNKGDAHADHK